MAYGNPQRLKSESYITSDDLCCGDIYVSQNHWEKSFNEMCIRKKLRQEKIKKIKKQKRKDN